MAVEVCYPTHETVELLLQKAFRGAKEVALEQKETAQKEDEEREKKNNRTAFAYFAVGGGSLLVLILLITKIIADLLD